LEHLQRRREKDDDYDDDEDDDDDDDGDEYDDDGDIDEYDDDSNLIQSINILTHSIAITKTEAELGERVPSISRPLEIQNCLDGILGHSRVE